MLTKVVTKWPDKHLITSVEYKKEFGWLIIDWDDMQFVVYTDCMVQEMRKDDASESTTLSRLLTRILQD